MYVVTDGIISSHDLDDRSYLVRVPELSLSARVKWAGSTDGTADGPTDKRTLPITASVLVCIHAGTGTGYILDTTPDSFRPADKYHPKPDGQRHGSTTPVEAPATQVVTDKAFDESGPGTEFHGAAGRVNRQDVGYGMTRETAFVKASESCGVWAILDGSLLRMVYVNRDVWGSHGSESSRVKGHEINSVKLGSQYFYETLGQHSERVIDLEVPAALQERLDRGDPTAAADLYALYQGMQLTAGPQILPRNIEIEGFVAGYEVKYVTRPGDPASGYLVATGIDVDKELLDLSEPVVLSGLSRIRRDVNGHMSSASVKGHSFFKTPDITVPQQVTRDEDLDEYADTLPDRVEDSPIPPTAQVAAFRAIQREHHKEDTHLGRVSERDGWSTGVSPIGDNLSRLFTPEADLSNTFEYELPPEIEVQIDHIRKETVRTGEAFFGLLEDGSFAVIDAYGSCFIMAGGNLYTSCPGDHIKVLGRNDVTLAGRSVILRGYSDVEAIATNGSVRVKAEKQLTLSGGMGGTGGLTLESKATAAHDNVEGTDRLSGGILILSKTYVGVETPRIDVQPESGTTVVTVDGHIHAKDVRSGTIDVGSLYAKSVQTPDAKIQMLTATSGDFGGTASNAILATWAGGAGGAPVPSPGEPPPVVVAPIPNSQSPNFDGSTPVTGTLLKPTSECLHAQGLSFPTSEEYGAGEDYRIPEAPWQTRDRLREAGGKWVENPVDGRVAFPGNSVWFGAGYQKFDNPDTGKPVARVYETERGPLEGQLVIC